MVGRLGAFAGATALFAYGAAFAQTPAIQPPAPATPSPGDSASSTQTFDPAYFTRYAPSNALDMVQQVPGFTLTEGDAVRGFGGAAGNILINGERPSTKSALSGLLGRISAASVIRIDLVTGASSTLDMRGQTKVVNVVVREDALSQPITFDATVRYTVDGRLTESVQASTQRGLFGGTLNISGIYNSLAANGPGGGSFVVGGRGRYNAAGVQTEYGEGYTTQKPLVQQLNFEYERNFDAFALHLNGAYGAAEQHADRYWRSYLPDSAGSLDKIERQRIDNDQHAFNLGGDIGRKFGDIDVKVITYNRREWNDNSSRFGNYRPSGALISATTTAPESKAGESILRGQVNWKLNDKHSIEFAAETAYNFLDNVTATTLETPSGVTIGELRGSDTKIEEFRNEFQISDVWKVSPSLTIEPGFKFETSRIEQVIHYQTEPDKNVEREFEYPKPSITGTWRIRPNQQLRLSYEREVAQLSFADFVSAADLVLALNTGGNENLVPEQTWAFNAEFEQRFWKGGVFTVFGSYDQVEDVQDFVLIEYPGNRFADAPGNIGDGTRWSMGFKTTLPLDNLGVKGARIDASLSGGGQEVTDPVNGMTREFSDEFKESWAVAFRHDFPALKFSYGFRISDGGPGTAYRYNETSRRARDDADIGAWAETSAFWGLRIRAGVDDLMPADFSRMRIFYTPNRATEPSTGAEHTYSTNGVQPYVRVSGKF